MSLDPRKKPLTVKIPITVIEFFYSCVPPTATHQAKHVIVHKHTRRAITTDTEALIAAKAEIDKAIIRQRPHRPMEGPLRITVVYVWPHIKNRPAESRHFEYEAKLSKPDADNCAKTCLDRMEEMRFFTNDSHIFDQRSIKLHGNKPGIYIKLEVVTAEEVAMYGGIMDGTWDMNRRVPIEKPAPRITVSIDPLDADTIDYI